MIRKLKYTFVFTILILMAGCSKDNGFDCIKSTGKVIREERAIIPYHFIELHDNINLFLTQDSVINSLDIEAGENLVEGITSNIDNGHLVLRNENKCDWLRSFDVPVNVYITFTKLDSIVFRAAGNLTFTNHWRNDSIQFDVWEGAGTIDLKLDVSKSRVYVHYGTVLVKASGTSQISFFSNKGYGPIDFLSLETNYTYMKNVSPNDCFIKVNNVLGVEIDNIGNVYYRGNPTKIDAKLSSSGKLIRME